RCQNHRHAVMNVDYQLVGIGGDNCKGPNPFARSRLLPVLPNASDAERRAILHRYRVGLLCLLTLDRPPFEEAIHRHNAAALAVRIAERRQVAHSLALGVDWLAPTCWVHTPVGNKAPAQRVQRYLPAPMVTSDDQ